MRDNSLRVPAFCPLCGLVMKGNKSNSTYYDYGTCVNCFIEFIEGREQRWNDGWRPSVEQVERLKSDVWSSRDS